MAVVTSKGDFGPYSHQGWKKPRFFGFFFGFFIFLGFNVHNAEHRYMTHDNSLHENICANSLLQCVKLPNLKVIDG